MHFRVYLLMGMDWMFWLGVYEWLDVRYNDSKYPLLTTSYKHSSIFFAPKCHCDPNKYFFDERLSSKTVDAHKYINL